MEGSDTGFFFFGSNISISNLFSLRGLCLTTDVTYVQCPYDGRCDACLKMQTKRLVLHS